MADVSISLEVELLVYSGAPVGSCGCPGYITVICVGHAHWVFMNMPPVFVFMAKDMMCLILLHIMCMGALCIVLGCLAG